MEGNFYSINGKQLPRVTSILSEMLPKTELENWKRRTPNHKDIASTAATVGTMMHWRILSSLSPVPLEMNDNMTFDKWPENVGKELDAREDAWNELALEIGEPRLVEHLIVYRDRFGFAGTADLMAPIDGVLTILDLKSSKKPVKSHELQLGAYYLGLLQEGYDCGCGMVVYLRKSGYEITELTHEELVSRSSEFMELVKRWYRKKQA